MLSSAPAPFDSADFKETTVLKKVVTRVQFENFGPLPDFEWSNIGAINLIVGKNGTGKTFLLKAIYAALKSLEGFGRGNEPETLEEILNRKMFWTFQGDRLGDLVDKSSKKDLSFAVDFEKQKLSYKIAPGATRIKRDSLVFNGKPRREDSVFIPAKEVLSVYPIIRQSRERDRLFGFDETYYDLTQAISYSVPQGRNYGNFAKSRKILKDILGGSAELDPDTQTWYFVDLKGNRYSINLTAEGIKKNAVLDRLLKNRYLTPGSVLIFDEPEVGVHPSAISQLWEIFYLLAEQGVQLFIATHSYFTVKKAALIAREHALSIPILSFNRENRDAPTQIKIDDLKEGMPTNEIIDESIRLYEEEVDLFFGNDVEVI